jgi:sugar transferase (PEP-CTERM/EpsH1 system associated)
LCRHAAVHLACLADEPAGAQAVKALEAYCERVAFIRVSQTMRYMGAGISLLRGGSLTVGAFRSKVFSRLVECWTREVRYDAVVISSSGLASYLEMPALRSVARIADFVDVDSQKWLDCATISALPRAGLYQLEARRLRRVESNLIRDTRGIFLASESEATVFPTSGNPGRVHVMSNGVDCNFFTPAEEQTEEACVFVGALDYLPNVDGVGWFCRNVWPSVRRAKPRARLFLVGRRPVAAVQRLVAEAGVEVVANVEDIRPYLRRARIAIVPLRIARGVQNKLLEAMAMGKAVVTTSRCLTPLRARAGVHVAVADCERDWMETILRILDDNELRNRLGSAAREYVTEHHSWERCVQPLLSVLGISVDPVSNNRVSEEALEAIR